MDCHSHGNAESFRLFLQRAKGTGRVNCYILRNSDVAVSRDNPQGSNETSCIPSGEQLFRIAALPFTAHFNGTIKL
jgi:hypothetical protein